MKTEIQCKHDTTDWLNLETVLRNCQQNKFEPVLMINGAAHELRVADVPAPAPGEEFTNASTAGERLRAVQDRAQRFEGLAADWAAKAQAQKLVLEELQAVLEKVRDYCLGQSKANSDEVLLWLQCHALTTAPLAKVKPLLEA